MRFLEIVRLERGENVRHLLGDRARANSGERGRQADLKARAWRDLSVGTRRLELLIGIQGDPVVADGREHNVARFGARCQMIERVFRHFRLHA